MIVVITIILLSSISFVIISFKSAITYFTHNLLILKLKLPSLYCNNFLFLWLSFLKLIVKLYFLSFFIYCIWYLIVIYGYYLNAYANIRKKNGITMTFLIYFSYNRLISCF